MAKLYGIEQCVESAAHLTKQLLGLARGGKYEIKAIDINELLLKSVNMFGRTRKEIQIHTNLHHEQIVVNVDQNQIEQALLNLFVNAWQAMPNGGKLYLETSVTSLDETYCKSHKIDPGCFCKISVTDTGLGMDDETRQCAFDPFFSTKDTEHGTGLGHFTGIDVYAETPLPKYWILIVFRTIMLRHAANPQIAGTLHNEHSQRTFGLQLQGQFRLLF